ncbi:MAG: OsmC family protein, partial [Candidatus Eremiobacteraeota bacterium]|nr:OsmC family protein [Candidatus Eremiobacteraeota bacterium]
MRTGASEQSIDLPAKPDRCGFGVNGGELLFLALGTCYCNDLYREARKRGIEISAVEVDVDGDFGAEGEA